MNFEKVPLKPAVINRAIKGGAQQSVKKKGKLQPTQVKLKPRKTIKKKTAAVKKWLKLH